MVSHGHEVPKDGTVEQQFPTSTGTAQNRDAEVDAEIPPSVFLNYFSLFLSHTHCISMTNHSVIQIGTLVGPVWTHGAAAAMLTAVPTPSDLSARLGDTGWGHQEAHPIITPQHLGGDGGPLSATVCRNHEENQARQRGELWVR